MVVGGGDGCKVMWLLLLSCVCCRERPRSRCRRRLLLLLLLLLSTRSGSVDRRGGADFSILIYNSFLATLGEKWADVSLDIFRCLLLFARSAATAAGAPPPDLRTHSTLWHMHRRDCWWKMRGRWPLGKYKCRNRKEAHFHCRYVTRHSEVIHG